MKFTILLVFAFSVAAYASGNAQTVNLRLKNAKVQHVLEEITKQTNVRFFYDETILNSLRPISVNVYHESVSDVLTKAFKGQNLTFRNVNGTVVISEKKQTDIEVTGTVRDSLNALAGVTVFVEGASTISTRTDEYGHYRLRVPRQSVLVFRYMGYTEQRIPVAENRQIQVTLIAEQSRLDEVVVVGYGTQKAATVTGSIVDVKGDVLAKAPVTNFSNTLAGRLPGLVAVSRSGEPGSDGATLRIRGNNTLGDNSPLIVVDGIANRSLERINPKDVESVTVLKDASAAIYGSQAANGVILVTTKKGKTGKPQISISHNQGFAKPTVIPDVTDAATYVQMLNEISQYAGQQPKYTAEDIELFRNGTDPWGHPNTDWYRATFEPVANQHQTNLTISGGQEYISYHLSAAYDKQDAIYKNSATTFNQYNFRANLNGKLNTYIKYGVNAALREVNRNYPTRSASDIFTMLRRGKPNMHAYWPTGENGPDIEYGNNPVVVTTNQTGYDRNKSTVLESRANIEISNPWIEGLSLSGNVAFDRTIHNNKLWQTPWYLYNWDGKSVDDSGTPILVKGQKGYTDSQLTQDFQNIDLLTLNALLNYEKTFGLQHHFKGLLGAEKIKGNTMSFEAFRKFFVSTALEELFAGGDAEKNNSGSSSMTGKLNYFGRFNYDYSNKYLLEFVWRYDGSYKFPKSGRFGFFPGVSLGWRISDEVFWKNITPVVNDLKFRASWGQTGNDRIDDYQYLASYGFATGASNIYVFNGDNEQKILAESRIPNPNVTWEIANQSNVGLDAQFLGNKLSLTAEYYYNLRSNILWHRNASVPTSTGLTLPRENIGEVENKGIELQVGYRNAIREFNYSVSANVATNKNKIRFWDETPGIPVYQQSTGRPMNADLYYRAIGVFRDQAAVDAYPHWAGARPGDIMFEDVNQDGKIDGLDRVRLDKTDLPTLTGGFNVDLSYKGFYSSIFFQWATGAQRNNYYEMQGEVGNYLQQDVDGRWTEENIDAVKPRIWNRYSEYWRSNANTYWLQASDYIRLKNFEFGYSIPQGWCEKMRIQSLQLYFTGQNLLTFTKVKDFDPETTSATAYPLNKVYNIGVSLTF
ncbi:TonB-dependent receptor [Sphingobacterium suaedae]|uniref:TonB-dependent receptor n=1 Tax=Sphingobacterium suaedae TaxID=1686402 RepID=A0ABW5KDH4_9SPHI